jgi:hypothetical protein
VRETLSTWPASIQNTEALFAILPRLVCAGEHVLYYDGSLKEKDCKRRQKGPVFQIRKLM